MHVTLKKPIGISTQHWSSQKRGTGSSPYSSVISRRSRWYGSSLQVHASFSDMSREAQEKAISYQLKQSVESEEVTDVKPATKRVEKKQATKSGDEGSIKTQSELAARMDSIVQEQMKDAIQRQLGTSSTEPANTTEEQREKPVEESKQSQNSKAPARVFEDGSLLFTSDQF